MTTTTRKILAVVLGVIALGFFGTIAFMVFSFKMVKSYGSNAAVSMVAPEMMVATGMSDRSASAGIPLVARDVDEYDAKMIAPSPMPGMGGAMEVPANQRLLVKTGTLSLQAKDVRWASGAVATYATAHGGAVINSSLEKRGNDLFGTVTIKVPADKFEATLTEIKYYGTVVSETTSGQDVTREYVDISARLKNMQASESQLLELMKRSGSITDILSVQRELTSVRSEIESMQAQVKYLQQSSSFSTLTVYISADPSELPVTPDPSERWQPKVVLKAALRALIAAGQVAVNTVIWIVIFIPVWGPILLVLWGLTRLIRWMFR